LIIADANIRTGNAEQPKAESMAIVGDSIIAVGTRKNIDPCIGGNTKLINMNGKFIIPGFIDTHVHLMIGGNSLLSVE